MATSTGGKLVQSMKFFSEWDVENTAPNCIPSMIAFDFDSKYGFGHHGDLIASHNDQIEQSNTSSHGNNTSRSIDNHGNTPSTLEVTGLLSRPRRNSSFSEKIHNLVHNNILTKFNSFKKRSHGSFSSQENIFANEELQHKAHHGSHGNLVSNHNEELQQKGHHGSHGNVVSNHNEELQQKGHHGSHGNVVSNHNEALQHKGHHGSHGNVVSNHNEELQHKGHHGSHGNVVSNHNEELQQKGHHGSHGNVVSNHNEELQQKGHHGSHGNVVSNHNEALQHKGHHGSHGNVVSNHNEELQHKGHHGSHGNVVSNHNEELQQKGHHGSHGNVVSYHNEELQQKGHHGSHGNIVSNHNEELQQKGHHGSHGNVVSNHNEELQHKGHHGSHGNVVSNHDEELQHKGHHGSHGNVVSNHNEELQQKGHHGSHGNIVSNHNEELQQKGHHGSHGNNINEIHILTDVPCSIESNVNDVNNNNNSQYDSSSHEDRRSSFRRQEKIEVGEGEDVSVKAERKGDEVKSVVQPPPVIVVVDDAGKCGDNEDNDGLQQRVEEKKEEIIPFEISDLIARTWRRINDSVPRYVEYYKKKNERNYGGERRVNQKTIRIFISSTFTDFFAEREVIVKKVLPEIQEWADKLDLRIVECDLRWGVPRNTDFKETIGMMMDELDRCIDTSDGKPFMVCLLGERYGWIPTRKYVSDDVIKQFDWVYPTSMTHMEITHGALRTRSHNALFMLRDADSLHHLPRGYHGEFEDPSVLAKQSLKRLKKELTETFDGQVFTYRSQVVGIDEANNKVQFGNLENFQTSITEFLKERITDYMGTLTKKHSDANERRLVSPQEIFIQKRSHLLLGREKELESLENFTEAEMVDGELDLAQRVLFVCSHSGTGKSSLLARHVENLRKKNRTCLWNFTCSSQNTTSSSNVLRHLCEELRRMLDANLPKAEDSLVHDYHALKKLFANLLKRVTKKHPGLLIIIDAINQFKDNWGKAGDWLPVPSDDINVKYVISSIPNTEDPNYTILMKKFYLVSEKLALPGLDKANRIALAKTYFKSFNKILDEEQMEALVSLPEANSPLFVTLACEEIRLFGVFENLTRHIKQLPGKLSQLISAIFNRLVKEDETHLLESALCLIYCSNAGLTETDLRRLLAQTYKINNTGQQHHSANQLPMMVWAKVLLKLKAFLMNTSTGDEEMFYFFHSSIEQAVKSIFLWDEDEEIELHHRLANHFLKSKQDNYYISDTILTHLTKAKMREEICFFFRDDPRSLRIGHTRKSLVIKNFRCTVRTSVNDTTLHVCRSCDLTKKIHPATFLSAQDTCMLCAQNIRSELFMDEKSGSGLLMPGLSVNHDKAAHVLSATVGPPVIRSKDRSARLCSLHCSQRQPSMPHTMGACFSCKRAYNWQFLYPLLCCNLCRMNGNCCVDFTTG